MVPNLIVFKPLCKYYAMGFKICRMPVNTGYTGPGNGPRGVNRLGAADRVPDAGKMMPWGIKKHLQFDIGHPIAPPNGYPKRDKI